MTKQEKKVYELPNIECIRHHIENGMISLMEASKTITELYYKGHLAYDQANTAIKLIGRIKVK